jgi:hypothetical protein
LAGAHQVKNNTKEGNMIVSQTYICPVCSKQWVTVYTERLNWGGTRCHQCGWYETLQDRIGKGILELLPTRPRLFKEHPGRQTPVLRELGRRLAELEKEQIAELIKSSGDVTGLVTETIQYAQAEYNNWKAEKDRANT